MNFDKEKIDREIAEANSMQKKGNDDVASPISEFIKPESKSKVKLTKNAKGIYQWEIQVTMDDEIKTMGDILNEIYKTDSLLREKFG